MVFFNFFAIFWEFLLTRRVGTNRNNNFYFFSFVSPFQSILASNEAVTVFFDFLNFFAIFLEFLLRVGKERNGTIIFIFSLSLPFSTNFGMK